MFQILHINCENGKYSASIMHDSVIMCDETIELYNEDAKANSYDETFFNEKRATCKTKKFLYFTCIFVNYYSIIDSC